VRRRRGGWGGYVCWQRPPPERRPLPPLLADAPEHAPGLPARHCVDLRPVLPPLVPRPVICRQQAEGVGRRPVVVVTLQPQQRPRPVVVAYLDVTGVGRGRRGVALGAAVGRAQLRRGRAFLGVYAP